MKFFVLLFLLSVFSFSKLNAQYVNGLMAIVGDESISLNDVLEKTAPYEKRLASKLKGKELSKAILELRKNMAEKLVDDKLIYIEFKNKKLKVPNQLIEKKLDRIIVGTAGGDREKFLAMLEARGEELQALKDKIAQDIAVKLLINESVFSSVYIKPKEILSCFNKNIEKYSQGKKAELLFIKRDCSEKGKKEMDDIYKQIKDGTPFDDCFVKNKSEGKAASFGTLELKNLKKELLERVANLKDGECTRPFEYMNSTYIICAKNIIKGKKAEFTDKIMKEIKRDIRGEKERKKYEIFIESLKKKIHIKKLY